MRTIGFKIPPFPLHVVFHWQHLLTALHLLCNKLQFYQLMKRIKGGERLKYFYIFSPFKRKQAQHSKLTLPLVYFFFSTALIALFPVWGMFTSLGVYLMKADTVISSPACVSFQWKSYLEHKGQWTGVWSTYDVADGGDCVPRSAQRGSKHSPGHKSRMLTACIFSFHIDRSPFFFHLKKSSGELASDIKEGGRMPHFLPLVSRRIWHWQS